VLRRSFLRHAAAVPLLGAPARPTRIRGRVSSTLGERGLGGIVVSDGLSSVVTGSDGDYEIQSNASARFVFVSTPREVALPVKFYRPLRFDASGEATVSFSLAPADDDGEAHRFLVFGDTQIADREDAKKLHEATTLIAEQTKTEDFAFGLTCGDLVDDALDLFDDYEAAVERLGVPFFQVVGNHDLDEPVGSIRNARTYERHFGPTHYSFNRGAVHYVSLNDVFWLGNGYVGFVSDDQLQWLESDLAHVAPGAPVVVFAHVPFLCTVSERIGGKIAPNEAQVTNRDRVLSLLEPFAGRFITAHTHENEHVFHGDVHEHVLGTVCGAWWTGPICWDGTPNGYHVFDIDGESISWHYRPTGRSPDEQFELYPPYADPSRPEVLANVWNWDPDWKVVWAEDGNVRGEMARARGVDPLARSLYLGPEKPLGNPDWVEPILTDHLFHAPVSKDAKKVTVEATDPFGRVYVDSLVL